MKKRNWLVLGLAGCMAICSAGCNTEETKDQTTDPFVNEKISSTAEETAESFQETTIVEETISIFETLVESRETQVMEESFSFATLKNKQFTYSSGAGAWSTTLEIHPDGTFDGLYHDSDMGDSGEQYPDGTVYCCEFTGKFTELTQESEYVYSCQLEDLSYADEVDTVEYIDDMQFVYTGACGIEGAEKVYFYLPGAKLADLPEELLYWIGYYDLSNVTETELSEYALYQEPGESGFTSYDLGTPLERAENAVSLAEMNEAELVEELQEKTTQMDMNLIADQIYDNWDYALNQIWKLLKYELSEEEFETLKQEQRDWISQKEEAVKKAGEECEGGSMQPLVECDTASEWTKQRVRELLEYLR